MKCVSQVWSVFGYEIPPKNQYKSVIRDEIKPADDPKPVLSLVFGIENFGSVFNVSRSYFSSEFQKE